MANPDPDEMKTCSICIEEIPWRDVVKFKRCQHGLCAQCYHEFLQTSNKCPVCRELIQDPDELFQECLQKLVISLARTNAALRRVRTAGQIRIDPSTETSSLLKTVQEKLHHLGGLMADTGIAHVGTSTRTHPPRGPATTSHNHHTTPNDNETDNDVEFRMDFNLLALALASAGIGNGSGTVSTSSTSVPPNVRGLPGSSSSTYTTEFYVSGGVPTSRPPASHQTPAQAPVPPATATPPQTSVTAPQPTQRRTATRRAPRTAAVAAIGEGNSTAVATDPPVQRTTRGSKTTRSRRGG